MYETIRLSHQLANASHAKSLQYSDEFFPPSEEQIDDPLGSPLKINQLHQLLISRGNTSGTTSPAFTVMASDTLQGHQIRCSCADPVSAKGYDLGHIMGCPDATTGNHRDLVSDTFLLQKPMDLGKRILDGHGDIFLGNIGSRASATIAPVQMNDMGACIITSHSHHIHISGRGDLDRHQRLGIHRLYPIHMLFMIFHRIDTVKRKGGK